MVFEQLSSLLLIIDIFLYYFINNDIKTYLFIPKINFNIYRGVNEINYKAITKHQDITREDLNKALFHPKKLTKIQEQGYEGFDDYYDFDEEEDEKMLTTPSNDSHPPT